MFAFARYLVSIFVGGVILTVSFAIIGHASNIETVERLTALKEKLSENIDNFYNMENKSYLLYKILGTFANSPYNVDIFPIERVSRARSYRVYEILDRHLLYLEETKHGCRSPFLELSLSYSGNIVSAIPNLVSKLETIQDRLDPKTKQLITQIKELLFSQQNILNQLVIEAETCAK